MESVEERIIKCSTMMTKNSTCISSYIGVRWRTINLGRDYYYGNATEKGIDNFDKTLVEIMAFCVRLDKEVMMSREKRTFQRLASQTKRQFGKNKTVKNIN